MAPSEKTGFDKYFDERMKNPRFATGYAREREAIDQVDALIRQLEKARINLGMSKAELARRIGKLPVVVRRLLTKKAANPTLMMAAKIASELGLKLGFVSKRPLARREPSRRRRHAKAEHRTTA